jgi:hypothetical protein
MAPLQISPEFLFIILANVVSVVWMAGRINAKIGERMATLETHMRHIMNKLGMTPREP